MNVALVTREKNINIVVVLYKKKIKAIIIPIAAKMLI